MKFRATTNLGMMAMLTVALLVGGRATVSAAQPAVCANGHSCTSECEGDCKVLTTDSSLTKKELARVVAYATREVLETGEHVSDVARMEEATGVTVEAKHEKAIRLGVVTKLEATEKGRERLAQLKADPSGGCSE